MRARQNVFGGVLIGAGVLFVAAVLPLPVYLITPGSAVDLSSAVRVGRGAVPRNRFFLTDVHLMRASPLRLVLAFFPGVTLAGSDTVVPRGVSRAAFDDVMQSAMTQSQSIAAVVAERAAGFAVPIPPATVEVASIDDSSLARGVLAVGDVIRGVGARQIRGDADVRAVIAPLPAGTAVRVAIDRAGRRRTVVVHTVSLQGRTRLGIILDERYGPPRLAVPVRYAIGDIGGSSGGLMMALRIYDGLRTARASAPRSFAGTGTIGFDGRVGAIEGTRQKLIAAKRAGASIFFVPRANYADIAGDRDVRVIPVETFGEAIRALDG
jgi:PDZ domain-containing protein